MTSIADRTALFLRYNRYLTSVMQSYLNNNLAILNSDDITTKKKALITLKNTLEPALGSIKAPAILNKDMDSLVPIQNVYKTFYHMLFTTTIWPKSYYTLLEEGNLLEIKKRESDILEYVNELINNFTLKDIQCIPSFKKNAEKTMRPLIKRLGKNTSKQVKSNNFFMKAILCGVIMLYSLNMVAGEVQLANNSIGIKSEKKSVDYVKKACDKLSDIYVDGEQFVNPTDIDGVVGGIVTDSSNITEPDIADWAANAGLVDASIAKKFSELTIDKGVNYMLEHLQDVAGNNFDITMNRFDQTRKIVDGKQWIKSKGFIDRTPNSVTNIWTNILSSIQLQHTQESTNLNKDASSMIQSLTLGINDNGAIIISIVYTQKSDKGSITDSKFLEKSGLVDFVLTPKLI